MNTKQWIAKSLDFRYFLKQLLWFGISFVLFLILALLPSVTEAVTPLRTVATVLLIPLCPITVYYILRLLLLFKGADDYSLCTAISKSVCNNYPSLSRSCAFVLEITKQDGTVVTAESRGIFKTDAFSPSYFGNYLNKPLQVLYHKRSGSVIVIGESESF